MDLIGWLVAVIGGIVVLNLIASELFAWGPKLSEWLMRHAVQTLAPGSAGPYARGMGQPL